MSLRGAGWVVSMTDRAVLRDAHPEQFRAVLGLPLTSTELGKGSVARLQQMLALSILMHHREGVARSFHHGIPGLLGPRSLKRHPVIGRHPIT